MKREKIARKTSRSSFLKAVVAIAVTLAFVMPVAAFVNDGTFGVISNSENTGDMENIVEISTNSDTSNIETTSDDNYNLEYTKDAIVEEETIDNAMPTMRNTIYVDDDADPSWYDATHVRTIQEGVTNASAGDTVYVYNGTYYENVLVNKSIDLTGESRENVIVDGNESGNVVYVTVNNVNIDAFTIKKGSYGIYLDSSSNNNITDCNVYDNSDGIYLDSSSNNNITDCNVYDNDYSGIYLRSSSNNYIMNCDAYNNTNALYFRSSSNHNSLIDCDAYDNAGYGIRFLLDGSSNYNNLMNCNAYNNDNHGIYFKRSLNNYIENCNAYDNAGYGIYLSSCSNNDIIDCNAYDNDDFGIRITSSSNNNNITNCDAYNNTDGIYLADSSNNNITNCDVYSNTNFGIYFNYAPNNKLRGNSFYDNGYQFRFEEDASHFYQDIDTSNTVSGKPIYYLVGQSDLTLNETHNFGYLGLVSCTNITAMNADVEGIVVVSTTDSTISNVSSHNSGYGILLIDSSDNDITDCEGYNTYDGISLRGSSNNNNIMNCDVYNSNYYGIELYDGPSNNDIINCNAYNNNYHGIQFYKSPNNNIINCDVYNNTDYGIELYRSSNINVTDCNVYNNTDYGIYISRSENVNLTNCDVYNNTDGLHFYGLMGSTDHHNIENCDVYSNTGYGIYLFYSSSNTLRGNSFYDNGHQFHIEGETSHFYYQDIDTSNTVSGKPIYYLVEQSDLTFDGTSIGYLGLVSCTNITAMNCDVEGLVVVSTTDSTIFNVSSHNAEYGIYLRSSSNNDIINCNAYDNNYYGMFLISSSDNNITNCDIYNNANRGIRLTSSLNNDITGCAIYNNANDGIYLKYSEYNNITNCDIYNNPGYGIYLRSSSDDNAIYHNNFINNTVSAFDQCNNIWDKGYPLGGNYWDDYTGVDEDDDGIGDTPYNISGGSNQDRYPLMKPIIAAPELLSPADGSATEDQTPTFDWDDVEPIYEVNYTLLVATDPGFSSIVINQTGLDESEYTPLSDLPFDTYYWKVKAMVGNFTTDWSETWSFSIALDLTPPTTPDLIEPTDGSTLITTPTIFFDWTDAYDLHGIDYYTLQIATDINFDNIVFDITPSDSDYTLTLTTPDDYYWRVQAVDNNGLLGSWSNIWMFTRLADTNPPVVELIYPVGGEYLSGDVIILWDATDDITPNVDLPITIEYRCGGPWQILASGEVNDGEYLWDTTGYPDGILYTIRISTEDFWGNIGSDESYATFTIDNTDPLTTAYLDPASPDGENDWYVSNVCVTLVATDETSGIDYTMYMIDNSGSWEEYVVPVTVSEDGEHTVEFYSVDNAGNEEVIGEVTFKIDKTVPTIDLTWDEENSKLVADVYDETSGVAMVEFYVNGELIGEVTSPPYEMEYDASSGDTAYAIVYDNAGNSAESEIIESSQSNLQSQTNPVLTRILQRYTMLKFLTR